MAYICLAMMKGDKTTEVSYHVSPSLTAIFYSPYPEADLPLMITSVSELDQAAELMARSFR